jgi:hypothetical protein
MFSSVELIAIPPGAIAGALQSSICPQSQLVARLVQVHRGDGGYCGYLWHAITRLVAKPSLHFLIALQKPEDFARIADGTKLDIGPVFQAAPESTSVEPQGGRFLCVDSVAIYPLNFFRC